MKKLDLELYKEMFEMRVAHLVYDEDLAEEKALNKAEAEIVEQYKKDLGIKDNDVLLLLQNLYIVQ